MKPFVVIDNAKIRITDLRDGTSEVFLKETGSKFILTDDEMRETCCQVWSDKVISSIKHEVGATRNYSE